jgi:hypothetical protein
MGAAQGKPPMIAAAAVAGKGKHHIIIFVVADPIVAALGFGQVLGIAAQPAAGHVAFLGFGRSTFLQLLNLTQSSLRH